MINFFKTLCVVASMLAGASPALAEYPEGAITLIVPFPASSPNDSLARYVAPELEKELGQTVVIANKPGSGGSVGSTFVAKSNPDGHSILLATASPMVIAPSVRSNYPFETLKAFIPILGINSDGMAIVVNANVKATTFKEFIDLARAYPGRFTFGTAGAGTAPHFAAELLMAATGVQLVHVPYQGGPAGLADLMAGRIDVMFNPTQQAAAAVKTGKARVIGVVNERRVSGLENVQTVVEAGVPQMTITQGWFGFFVPSGSSRKVVTKLEAALGKVFSSDDFKLRIQTIGIVGNPMVGDEFKNRIVSDLAIFKKIARERNIVAQN